MTLSTHRPARGFTLLELLVVILIIGLLTGIVGPRFLAQINRSQTTTALAQIDAIDKALMAYRFDVGRFPAPDQGLAALSSPPPGETKWRGPYLQAAVPADPWGHAYVYELPGPPGHDYRLASLGRDGAPGGQGEDADIER